MQVRGLYISHTTIIRWVHQYTLKIEQRIRTRLKPKNNSCGGGCEASKTVEISNIND